FRFALPPENTPREEVAARLLGPARAAIAKASRVHVLTCGALRQFDFHALPFEGGTLLDHAVVTYGTDRSPPSPAARGPQRALIVADPNDNLAGTIDEAARVERAIGAAPGWTALPLLRDDATSPRVRDALGAVSWFHYAGHGAFDARSGLASALVLANGT